MSALLLPGDPAPWFRVAASNGNADFAFNSVAGRFVLLGFFGSSATPEGAAAIEAVLRARPLFNDAELAFFGVSCDEADPERLQQLIPGIRYFWDLDRAVSRLYGAETAAGYRPFWLLLDPLLRVVASLPIADTAGLEKLLAGLPPVGRYAGCDMHAPVLILPNVFDRAFCRQLIALYERSVVEDSGFMREVDGKTVRLTDHSYKRRSDARIADEAARNTARELVRRRIVPEIRKCFQFAVTRIERDIIACYDAERRGAFSAHRDNTTKGTAHRRFAVTVNLNAEEFEGGELRFAEFGPRTYRAPTGGAVVFSCSLLHEATPVTAGRRYAYLPFLYDDAAAAIRAANNVYLADHVGQYRGSVAAE